MFGAFWRMLKGYRWPFVLVACVIIVSSLAQLAFPWLYKLFFDALTNTTQSHEEVFSQLFRIIGWMLGLHVVTWSVWRVSGFMSAKIYPKAATRIRLQASDELLHHSYRFFTNHFSGSVVRRVNRFVDAFGRIGDKLQWEMVPLAVAIVGITILLGLRSLWLSLLLGIWIVLFILVNLWLSLWKLKYDMRRAALDSEVTGALADTLTNATNVKLFSAYEHEHDRYQEVVERHQRLWVFTWSLSELIVSVQVFLMIAVELGVLYAGSILWDRGVMTVGDFALLQGYMIGLFEKLWNFGRNVRELYEQVADASEMAEILNTPYEVKDRKTAKPLFVSKGKIEFHDVSFHYHQTRKILEHFDLTIKPGEKVALVGSSGAGKSTVTKLLLRLFDIDKGEILIDGQKISQVTMESLWEQISLVPQEPILFHRSLMENIRYGRRDATDEEVFEAARKARCHVFIEEMSKGYETFVGERGVKLSGGERQRVAIARAILKNAPILVLDEATSSLDSESESLIQEALVELMKGKTTIVIAHRLSTIMRMDRIVVIEDGTVSDMGTHKELLKKAGTYKKLWNIQAGGFV